MSRYDEPYQPTSSSELKTVVIVGIAVATEKKQLWSARRVQFETNGRNEVIYRGTYQ